MHFNDLRKVIMPLLESKVSLELISAPGRGKSEFVEDLIPALSKRDGFEWGFATCFLATMTPPDLIGYIFKGEMEGPNGRPIAVSEATLPLWMITRTGKPLWAYKRGILFLDELGQAQTDVKASAAELLRAGRVGPHSLPEGWSVIAASNRTSDRSGVTKSLDFLINRRGEVHITDDLQSWEDWAFKAGIEPLFISFANQNPNIVFSDGVPDKQGPWCTPRSLVMLSRMLDKLRGDDGKIPTDKIAVELAGGMIGQAASAQLFAHVRLGHEMPSLEDIIKDPKKARVADKPDANILITYNLAARVNASNVDKVLQYMQRLPKEFAVTFAKAACRRDPELVYSKPFEQWSSQNASLMVSLVEK